MPVDVQSEAKRGSASGPKENDDDDEYGRVIGATKEHDRCSVWTTTSTLHPEEPENCTQSLQDDISDEEDPDPILDAMLASSFLALQSAQQALQKTLSDRKQLAKFKADERALELLMGKREVELLTRLEANRRMAECVEQRTRELQSLLKSSRPASASLPGAPRRHPSYSSSRGSWNLGAAVGDLTVGDGKGAAVRLSGIGDEGSVTGILEAPHDQGVTVGKSAARRLEKMLGQQAGKSEGSSSAGGRPRGSYGEERDARSMLGSVAAASSFASPSASASTSAADEGLRSPKSEASRFGFFSSPYLPRTAESSSYLSARSSSGVSTVTAASFTTAKSASATATSDASEEQMEELVDDGDSSSLGRFGSPKSPSLSSSTSQSSPGASRPPSYFAGARATSSRTLSTSPSRSNSPKSPLLNRRQRLHRSHPSAPAVVSAGSTTTASSSIWSPGYFTTGDRDSADPFETKSPTAGRMSTFASTSEVVQQRRPSHPQRRSASASASGSAASAFSSMGPGGHTARASASSSLAPAPAPWPSKGVVPSSSSTGRPEGVATASVVHYGSVREPGAAGSGGGWGLGSWINGSSRQASDRGAMRVQKQT